jgi:arylsulfatase A-like enzyme
MASRTVTRTVVKAAIEGAIVWAWYGIVETLVLVAVVLLKRALEWAPPGAGPFISMSVTATALTAYPVCGALAGAAAGAILGTTRVGGRIRSDSFRAAFASSGALVALTLAFGVHAFAEGESREWIAAAVPLVIAAIALRASPGSPAFERWAPMTHPVISALALVGGGFLLQRRSYLSGASQLFLAAGYLAALPAVAFAGRAIGRRARGPAGHPARIRTRRHAFGLLYAVALVGGPFLDASWEKGTSTPLPSRTATARPNVILITLDTVRADHLGLYGYARNTTPRLGGLAAQAVVYRRAFSSSNWTLPGHASMLTGLSPLHHGARMMGERPQAISSRAATMAQILDGEGYRTAGFVANSDVLIPFFGFARGFQRYKIVRLETYLGRSGRPFLLRELVRGAVGRIVAPGRVEAEFASADMINAEAHRFLHAADTGDKPFLLFLNYMDAHAPYVPPSPFEARFAGKDPGFKWSAWSDLVRDVSIDRTRHLQDRDVRHLTSQYDGAIAYLDARVGDLLDDLRENGLFDDSLIIVTSDHGEGLGQHDIVTHKMSLYQHQVHVPLIIKYPGSARTGAVDTIVGDVDILPKMLDVIGVAPPRSLDGRTLRTVRPDGPACAMSQSSTTRYSFSGPPDDGFAEVSLTCGSYKLIRSHDGALELFDLSSDPDELHNVYGARTVPRAWLTILEATLDEARRQGQGARPAIEPDVANRLRALGYVR